jgi:hypothetical protein
VDQSQIFDFKEEDELVLDKKVKVIGYLIQSFAALRLADGITP